MTHKPRFIPQRLLISQKKADLDLLWQINADYGFDFASFEAMHAHPDVFYAPNDQKSLKVGEKDPKKEENEPTVRNFIQFASEKPFFEGKKLIFVENAERFTPVAANALLKILEEPPKYLFFLFTTENPYALLQTIRSRMTLRFMPQENPQIPLQNAFLEAQDLFSRLQIIESWDKAAKTEQKDDIRGFFREKLEEMLFFARFRAHLALPAVSEALLRLNKNTNVRFTAEWLAVALENP